MARLTCVLAVLAAPCMAAAQSAPTAPPLRIDLAMTGRIEHPRHLDLADLEALPAALVEVSPLTHHGVEKARFTGVSLWLLVTAAAPVDAPGPGRTFLQHTLFARGRDGYAVALAIAELDPAFEGKSVLVAYRQDGKALPALRLVVPLDARAGRSVKDLVSIEIR